MALMFLMGEERAGAQTGAQAKRADEQFPFRATVQRDGWRAHRYSKSG